MTHEIRLAFAHPSERAAASATDTTFDRISLRDYIVSVDIGAFQKERGKTQRVGFNVVVEVSPIAEPIDDDVDRILSYDRVIEAIDIELSAERLNLLETLAERIADRILAEPQAMRVFVRIEKLDRGPFALGVEIVRAKGGKTKSQPMDGLGVAHPKIVYLSNSAIADDKLGQWINQLQNESAPSILCVGLPDGPRPVAKNALAQRRIDLLAIEQNAWQLAARDPRCVVVATKTELDWGVKHGQICVWAPSKMILDAVDPPKADAKNAEELAGWLAQTLDARQFVLVGTSVLPKTSVPTTFANLAAVTL